MGPLVMYYLSLIVSIHASATKESLIVPLEQSFGASGAWRPRVEVTLEPHTQSWKPMSLPKLAKVAPVANATCCQGTILA